MGERKVETRKKKKEEERKECRDVTNWKRILSRRRVFSCLSKEERGDNVFYLDKNVLDIISSQLHIRESLKQQGFNI
jgi:hypothetical protein